MNNILKKQRGLFNRIESLNSKIKHKSLIVILLFILMLSITIVVPTFLKSNSFSTIVSLDSLVLGGIIFLTASDEKLHFKIKYIVLTAIIGASFLINGLFFHVIGYLAIAICFLILIPLANLALGKKNIYFEYMAKAILIVYTIFLVVSILMGQGLDANQYQSFLGNPNIVGNFMMIVAPSSLYLLYINKDWNFKTKIFIEFLLCSSLSICFFSNSRTSFFSNILQLLLFVFVVFINMKKFNRANYKIIINNIVVFILVLALSFGGIFWALTGLKTFIAKQLPSIQIEINYSEGTNLDKSVRGAFTRFEKGLGDDDRNGDQETFTSGRRGIWKAFYKDLSFIGHPKESKKIIIKDRSYEGTNAHNVYLQIAYSSGIIAGISMLLIMVFTAFDILKYIWSSLKGNGIEPVYYYSMSLILGFSVVSMTSGGYMLFTYMPATFFWLTLGLFSLKKQEE